MEAGCERHLCVMKYDSFESVEKVLKSILALPHKTASAEETNRLVNTISNIVWELENDIYEERASGNWHPEYFYDAEECRQRLSYLLDILAGENKNGAGRCLIDIVGHEDFGNWDTRVCQGCDTVYTGQTNPCKCCAPQLGSATPPLKIKPVEITLDVSYEKKWIKAVEEIATLDRWDIGGENDAVQFKNTLQNLRTNLMCKEKDATGAPEVIKILKRWQNFLRDEIDYIDHRLTQGFVYKWDDVGHLIGSSRLYVCVDNKCPETPTGVFCSCCRK